MTIIPKPECFGDFEKKIPYSSPPFQPTGGCLVVIIGPEVPPGLSHPTNIQTQGPLQRQTEPNRRKLGDELCKNHLGMDLF